MERELRVITRCRECEELVDETAWPFCVGCGILLVDMEELDLSPDAPLDVIFKRREEQWKQ